MTSLLRLKIGLPFQCKIGPYSLYLQQCSQIAHLQKEADHAQNVSREGNYSQNWKLREISAIQPLLKTQPGI
jgi:hypothetical protein